MKVEVKSKKGLRTILSVIVDKKNIQTKMDERLKELQKETKIYCGHEYTLKNSEFCLKYDKNNKRLQKKITEIKNKVNNNIPTVPSTIDDEIACNIFLRAKTLGEFSKLRDLKDNF